MSGRADDGWAGWTVDAVAATLFGGAVAFAVAKLAGPLFVLPATSLGFGLALAGLRQWGSSSPTFALPAFRADGFVYDLSFDELLLVELAEQPQLRPMLPPQPKPWASSPPVARDAVLPPPVALPPMKELLLTRRAPPLPEPLLLDDPIPVAQLDDRVVHLFGARPPLPTAGELSARIDAHLRQSPPPGRPAGLSSAPTGPGATVHSLNADASAALHQALADLKRTLASRRA